MCVCEREREREREIEREREREILVGTIFRVCRQPAGQKDRHVETSTHTHTHTQVHMHQTQPAKKSTWAPPEGRYV